jgi:ribosomal protein L9
LPSRPAKGELLTRKSSVIVGVTVEYSGKANDKGHLFAGIHKDEIINALKEQDRLDITAEYIDLEKPIKEVGEHKITVNVQGKTAEFTLVVKAL